MAKKNFQQFMLEKGDRIGLGLALVIMLAAIGFGAAYVPWSASAYKVAQDIEGQSVAIMDGLALKKVKDQDPLPEVIAREKVLVEASYPDHVTRTEYFGSSTIDGGKRLNPPILPPVEYQVDLVRGQIKSLMLNIAGKDVRMGVLIPTEKKGQELTPQQKAWMEWNRQRLQALAAMYGGNMPGGAANNPMFPGGQAGLAPEDEKGKNIEWKLDWADVGRIPPGAKLAETVTPRRMVVVNCSFPYRQQLLLYQQALRQPTIQDLAKKDDLLPKFLGFHIKRRTLDAPGGKVKEDWRDLELDKDFRPLLQTAVGTEPELPDIQKLAFPGLAMGRPILARGIYPEVKLALIAKTLRLIGNKPVTVELTPFQKRVAGGDADIFGPLSRPDEKEPNQPMPEQKAGENKEVNLPDHCLVRFLDVTVKPGLTYEYQLQIRAANPNLGKKNDVAYPALANVRELVGPWWPEKAISISLPHETHAYAYELDDKALYYKVKSDPSFRDAPVVQIHKWLETTTLNPDQARSVVPVGSWVVGEVPVRRGEYIGRVENVEVPIWFPTKEDFAFAVPIPGAVKGGFIGFRPVQAKGIPINLTTNEVLVDYEGGKIVETFKLADKSSKDVRETANVELLVLGPDGRLRVRNSRQDVNDQERQERAGEWDRWRDEVRKNMAGKGGKSKNPFDR